MNPQTPLIIAHRGASEDAQENTLEALQLAVQQGADMVEMDVRCTKDQILVLNHNDRLKSFRPTIKISQLTYDELVQKGFTLPKLEEVLQVLPPGVLINLDLKNTAMDLPLRDVISRLHIEPQIYFDSNNARLLERYEIFFPEAKFVLNSSLPFDPFNLYSTRLGAFIVFTIPLVFFFVSRLFTKFFVKRKLNRFSPSFVSLLPHMCTRANVDFFHSLGIGVFVSPINKEENMRRFIERHVDGIKTDNPSVLFSILHEEK